MFDRVTAEFGGLDILVNNAGTDVTAPIEEISIDAFDRVLSTNLLDVSGKTTLAQFGALVQGAALVVANDTGISHVAAGLGTPSVIVSCGSDPERWAPLDRRRHRVLAAPAPCRPCSHRICPTAHECATGTTVDDVLRIATELLETEHA